MMKLKHSTASTSKTLSPYLFGFSLLGLVIGASIFYIEQKLNTLSGGLVVFGGLGSLILLYLMTRQRDPQTRPNELTTFVRPKRWMKLAIVFCITAGSVIFIAASQYLANSSTIRWDVTQDKQHTLSENTINFVGKLTNEVKLTAFYVGLPPTYLSDMLQEYERASSGLITAEIIDPLERIAYAAKFGNAINGKERKVIVQSGSSRKDVDFTRNSLSEERLSNAIVSASRPPRNVYFLTGHGEYSISNEEYVGLSKLKQLLADNNIHSKPLMLGISQSIPLDCDVLIIAGPKNKLTAHEESIIADYLAKGGDALFLIEHTLITTPNKPLSEEELQKNPSLNTLLNQWGLNVQSDMIIDLTNHIGDDVGSPATKNYQQHKAITEGLDYTFYVRPRSIRVLENRRPGIKLAVIASTESAENSWGETNRTLDIRFDPNTDTAGPVAFSYVVFEEKTDTNTQQNNESSNNESSNNKSPSNKLSNNKSSNNHKSSDTRIIVFTDADFLTNVYIHQYSNAQMGLNIINWLAELDYTTFLDPKEIKVERLDLTSKQQRQIIVILFLMPFGFAIIGVVVWLKSLSD